MEVKLLMYAFGDDPNPSPESVAVLEDIVTEYITEMVSSVLTRHRADGDSVLRLLGLLHRDIN